MALFNCLDINHDGKITLKEWTNAFDMIDDNHNGVISRKEWCLHEGDTSLFDSIIHKKHLAVISREEWHRAFKMLDDNNDGVISVDQLMVPKEQGKTVHFDMEDCRDLVLLRGLVWQFDGRGACISQCKPEPTCKQRLCFGDRIVSINDHSVLGAPREELEYHFWHAQSSSRYVHLKFEAPWKTQLEAAPKVGDRLQAFRRPGDALESDADFYKKGDFGRISAVGMQYLYITWERTGETIGVLIQDWNKYFSVVGTLKAVPEKGDMVKELPGDPYETEGKQLGRVTDIYEKEVHIYWKATHSQSKVLVHNFLKFYTCVGKHESHA